MLPIDTKLGEIEANIAIVEGLVETMNEVVDLVVLPELCFTGFCGDAQLMHRLSDSSALCIAKMQKLAGRTCKAICGGFLERDGNKLFNKGFMIAPDESTLFYTKRHLFCSGEESKLFTPGSEPSPTFHYKTWKIKMAICYDLRFPVWCRNVGLEYDALIVPANWPDARSFPWQQLLSARAIENQAFVVGCDRSGADVYGKYSLADSAIFDCLGRKISTEVVASYSTATLSAELLNRSRDKFTPYLDADKFTLDLQ